MMDRDHLHLLINEEIYVISDDKAENQETEDVSKTTVEEISTVSESAPEPLTKNIPSTPEVPKTEVAETVIPVAVFHESSESHELELLQKIIDACNLETGSYEVFANGFSKEVKFKKALVFVDASKSFYQPIPYQGSQILCSKPLSEITTNQQEKVKLWNALKVFF